MCIIDCGYPPSPIYGKVTLTNPGVTTESATATQTCIPGYDLSGRVGIFCRRSGSWSAPPVKCSLKGMLHDLDQEK